MDWRENITIASNVCPGQACIKGTSVVVSVILDNLATNVSQDAILHGYSSLDQKSVQTAIAYAAELSRERIANPASRVSE